MENLRKGPEQQQKRRQAAPTRRRIKFNKVKFFTKIALFAVLVAIGIVGVHSFMLNAASATPVSVSEQESGGGKALAGRVIVLDPGHGGFDPGATGISGERESDLNLKMASVLQDELQAESAKVVMTRADENAIAPTKDEDMAKRREITQKNPPDLFISIHMNDDTDPSIQGPIILFQQGSIQGEELAQAIEDGINSNLEPLAPCKHRSADLIVLRGNTQPSVLVECGFISNSMEEQKLLQDAYRKQFCSAVTKGAEIFFQREKQS